MTWHDTKYAAALDSDQGGRIRPVNLGDDELQVDRV
jgi:hypothetical protein